MAEELPEVMKLIDEIHIMSEENAEEVDIPVKEFIQIAQGILARARRDIAKLKNQNYQVEILERIELHIAVLIYYSKKFEYLKSDRPETQKEYSTLRDQAEDVRYELLAAMDLAFDDYPNLQTLLHRVREGGSAADLIDDLNVLEETALQNVTLLESINFDKSILDEIPELSSKLSKLLAESNLDTDDSVLKRIDRDKAYTQLRTLLSKLIKYGQYIHRHNSRYYKCYQISYTPRSRKSKKVEEVSIA